jgi:hypothetical protein
MFSASDGFLTDHARWAASSTSKRLALVEYFKSTSSLVSWVIFVVREYKMRPGPGNGPGPMGGRLISTDENGGGVSNGAPEGSFDDNLADKVQSGCCVGSFSGALGSIGRGVLLRPPLDSDGLRNEPLTLAKDALVEIDPFLLE